MPLRSFDIPVSEQQQDVTAVESAPAVIEKVEVISTKRSYLMTDPKSWTWSQLRDYVIHELESRYGAEPRNEAKEAAIFRRFLKEWSDQAGPIAVHAFKVENAWWKGSRISINRFCKASDEYFAQPIADRLANRQS